ncbi:MAG: hypothetical protein ACLP0J_27420 [Solirubrobacteraceae bacterium]
MRWTAIRSPTPTKPTKRKHGRRWATAVALRRTANSDGTERHTAPTLILTTSDSRTAVIWWSEPKAFERAFSDLYQ